jgi:hypothetical protein
MSYNISTWRTKYLSDFSFSDEDVDWLLEQELPEIFELLGSSTNGRFTVSNISICGEWSGRFYHDTFLDFLSKSSGKMLSLIIWEGGDTISAIKVEDGVVTEMDDDQEVVIENTTGQLPLQRRRLT